MERLSQGTLKDCNMRVFRNLGKKKSPWCFANLGGIKRWSWEAEMSQNIQVTFWELLLGKEMKKDAEGDKELRMHPFAVRSQMCVCH